MTKIYGVDLEEDITPLMVRDAMIECFYRAHCVDAEIDLQEGSANKSYCQQIVEKAFTDSGGDFENPTKNSILAAMSELKKFSENFRDPKIIQKHAQEIMKLVEKLQ